MGDSAQKSARSFTDFLAMEKVAGVLVGDAGGNRLQRSGEVQVGQKFGDVAHFCSEGFGCRVFGFILCEKVIVLFQSGAAAGSVGDDGVKVFKMEREKVFAGEIASGITYTGMGGERSTTELIVGNDDIATVGGKNADGGFI